MRYCNRERYSFGVFRLPRLLSTVNTNVPFVRPSRRPNSRHPDSNTRHTVTHAIAPLVGMESAGGNEEIRPHLSTRHLFHGRFHSLLSHLAPDSFTSWGRMDGLRGNSWKFRQQETHASNQFQRLFSAMAHVSSAWMRVNARDAVSLALKYSGSIYVEIVSLLIVRGSTQVSTMTRVYPEAWNMAELVCVWFSMHQLRSSPRKSAALRRRDRSRISWYQSNYVHDNRSSRIWFLYSRPRFSHRCCITFRRKWLPNACMKWRPYVCTDFVYLTFTSHQYVCLLCNWFLHVLLISYVWLQPFFVRWLGYVRVLSDGLNINLLNILLKPPLGFL